MRTGAGRTLLRAAAGLLVSAVATLVVVQSIDLDAVGRALGRAGWTTLAAVAVFIGLDVAARAMRWRALVRPLKRVSPGIMLAHTLIGYLANSVLPARLGEVVRSFTLGTKEGISKATVGGTIVVERFLDVAALSLISLAAVLVTPAGPSLQVGVALAVVLSAAAAVTVMVLAWPATRRRLTVRARGLTNERLRALAAVLVRLAHGLSVVRSPRALGQAMALGALAWSLTAVAFAVAARSLGLDLSPAQIILFVAATNLVTVIPAGPAYLGTFELAALSVASAIGVSATSALAMAVLVHAAIVGVTTLGGLVAFGNLYGLPSSERIRELATERSE